MTGFDPWDESTKALADLIEKEGTENNYRPGGAPYPPAALLNHHYLQHMNHLQHPPHMLSGAPTPVDTAGMAPKNLPPGFSANHFGAFTANPSRLPLFEYTAMIITGADSIINEPHGISSHGFIYIKTLDRGP